MGQVQEVTSPRSITRTTQQVVTNNQAVSAPIPAGSVGISHGTSHVNVGNVGTVSGGVVAGGIVGGGVVGSTVIGGGSHYGGSVGLPVGGNSVIAGQRLV